RKRRAGDEGRKKNDDHRHDEPSKDEAGETEGAEGTEEKRQRREAIAERERNRHRDGLDRAQSRERPDSCTRAANERVNEAAASDSCERHGQNQSERVRRSAEKRRKHSVPDELHQKKRKPHDGSGRVHQSRGGRSEEHTSELQSR